MARTPSKRWVEMVEKVPQSQLAGCNEHDAAQWLMTIAVYGVAFSPVWLYFLFH